MWFTQASRCVTQCAVQALPLGNAVLSQSLRLDPRCGNCGEGLEVGPRRAVVPGLAQHHQYRQATAKSSAVPSATVNGSTGSSSGGSGKSRAYPTEPRVGVGVVVFRKEPVQGEDPEILLVRRGKEPDKGRWCFPGGSLELGETLTACAAREVEEEAGIRLQGPPHDTVAAAGATDSSVYASTGAGVGQSGGTGGGPASAWRLRDGPMPFAAVDVMQRDSTGKIRFHYAVIEVAAVSADADAVLQPGDDADGAQWVPVSRLRGMADLTVRCDEMAEEAVIRFSVSQHSASTAQQSRETSR